MCDLINARVSLRVNSQRSGNLLVLATVFLWSITLEHLLVGSRCAPGSAFKLDTVHLFNSKIYFTIENTHGLNIFIYLTKPWSVSRNKKKSVKKKCVLVLFFFNLLAHCQRWLFTQLIVHLRWSTAQYNNAFKSEFGKIIVSDCKLM